jgi:uncharacterized protein YvpB
MNISRKIILFILILVLPISLTSFITYAALKINDNNNRKNIRNKNITSSTAGETTSTPEQKDITNKNSQSADPNPLRQAQNILPDKQVNNIKEDKPLPSEAMLKIPLILQIYNLSCEAASLQMALKYRGLDYTQDELMVKIGYAEPFKKRWQDGKMIWGDPDLGIVGNEKGYLFTTSSGLAGGNGWGVNNGPVAKAAEAIRPGSFEKDKADINDLKRALANDQPVIFWHARNDARKEVISYFTPEGKEIKLFQNHVNILTGYQTKPNGTTVYYFNDPIYGKYSLSEKDMLFIWNKYNNDIVVVN